MELTGDHINWIEENKLFFTSNIRPSQEQIHQLFFMLTHLDGKVHKPTGCGRCVASARNRVWAQYQKQLESDDN